MEAMAWNDFEGFDISHFDDDRSSPKSSRTQPETFILSLHRQLEKLRGDVEKLCIIGGDAGTTDVGYDENGDVLDEVNSDDAYHPLHDVPKRKELALLNDLAVNLVPISLSMEKIGKEINARVQTLHNSNEDLQRPSTYDAAMDVDLELPRGPPGGLTHLPPEIVSVILEMAMEGKEDTPIIISHVNKHLRAVVHANPRLWKHIDIMRGISDGTHRLERLSGTLPLDVTISLPPILQHDQGIARIVDFLTMIERHCHRIRKLKMQLVYRDWFQLAVDFVFTHDLPLLTDLDAGLFNTWDVGTGPNHYSLVANHASALRSVERATLTNLQLIHWDTVSGVSLRFLHYMTTDSLLFSGFLHLLRLAPNLEELVLEDTAWLTEPEDPMLLGQIHSETLHSVSFIRMRMHFVKMLASVLDLSHLHTLVVQEQLEPFELVEPTLDALSSIARKALHLRHLDLEVSQIPKELFEKLSDVTHLRLAPLNDTHFYEGCMHYIRCLAVDQSSDQARWEISLPELRELELEVLELELDRISQAILSRSRAGIPLQRLTLHGVDPWKIDAAQMDALRDAVGILAVEALDLDTLQEESGNGSETEDGESVGSWASGDEEVRAKGTRTSLHWFY